jgi:small subunit ribosomal protein S17
VTVDDMTDEAVATPSDDSASDAPEAAHDGAVAVETSAQPATSTEPATSADRARRKTREGVVVSNKMDKTAVVAVVDRVRHAKYNKFVLRTKKLYAHDEANDVNIGDKVRVMETRPLSKNKRWRVTEVLERAK